MRPIHRGRKREGAGFSLVEVLVSIVVLSFGLLGMVGMQAAALRANRDARLQSAAVLYARELAEIVASNPVDTRALADNKNPFVMSFLAGATTVSGAACLTQACTTLDFTQAQLDGWKARISAGHSPEALPGVRVVSCFDQAPYQDSGQPTWECTPGGPLVVKIGWTRQATKGSSLESPSGDNAQPPQVVLPIGQ